VVLSVVQQSTAHSPIDDLAPGRLSVTQVAGRFSADVCHYNVWPIPDLVTCPLDSAAEVNFFSIHKEAWVKKANVAQYPSSYNRKSARDPIRL
jgi:hypothetical protein